MNSLLFYEFYEFIIIFWFVFIFFFNKSFKFNLKKKKILSTHSKLKMNGTATDNLIKLEAYID